MNRVDYLLLFLRKLEISEKEVKRVNESMNAMCDGMHFETGNWFVLVFRSSDTFLCVLKWNNQCHSLISNESFYIGS